MASAPLPRSMRLAWASNEEVFAVNVQKQIDYWRCGAEDELGAARSLLAAGHLRQALFMAHLAVEKMLKAHVARCTADMPPRTHSLPRLAELARLQLTPDQEEFLRRFNAYQLAGRYPDAEGILLDPPTVRARFSSAEEIVEWLKAGL